MCRSTYRQRHFQTYQKRRGKKLIGKITWGRCQEVAVPDDRTEAHFGKGQGDLKSPYVPFVLKKVDNRGSNHLRL